MKKIESLEGYYIPISREAYDKLLEMGYDDTRWTYEKHTNKYGAKWLFVVDATITSISKYNGWDIAYLHSDGFFYDEQETERKQMTLQDLETGMIVEHADGILGIWISGTSISCNGGISSDMLNNDLTSDDQGFVIVKVYSTPTTKEDYNAGFNYWFRDKNILNYCTLLWEREKPIEMTMEEALEELSKLKGKKVKITG